MNRSPDYRRRQTQLAVEPTDTTAHLGAGHEGRDAGYEERGGAVQSVGDGERRVGGGGGFDTHWLGGGGGCYSLILVYLVELKKRRLYDIIVVYIYMVDWI